MTNEIELTSPPDLAGAKKAWEDGSVPRWVFETYPGMEQDIWTWLHSFYYWEQVLERDAKPRTAENKAVVSANSHMKTVQQTMALRDATDRSCFLQLYYAHKSGWPGIVGHEGVQELLQNIMDAYSSKGAISEMTFIVKTLIPKLEQMGTPPELVFSLAENISKARSSVSTFRKLIAEGDEEEITNLLNDVANPKISSRQFREDVSNKMASREPTVKAKAPAHVYLIPGGEIIIIESTPAHTMAIERSIKGIAGDFSIRTGLELMNFLKERLTPKKEDMKRYKVKGAEVVRDGKGRLMPTPEKFHNLCIQEVVRSRFLVDQLLAIDGKALVPIHVSMTDLPEELIEGWLTEAFLFEGKKPIKIINSAFNNFYNQIPTEVMGLWPFASYEVKAEYQKMGGSWGIFLDIVTR